MSSAADALEQVELEKLQVLVVLKSKSVSLSLIFSGTKCLHDTDSCHMIVGGLVYVQLATCLDMFALATSLSRRCLQTLPLTFKERLYCMFVAHSVI